MDTSQAAVYEICIGGHLDDHRADWLNGLTLCRQPGGVTSLTTGPIDQAALFGLLSRIRDLGATLISVQRHTPARPLEQD